jgi:REP-associated tyrosine transposase
MGAELVGGHRRSIRLSSHDYARAAGYFFTLCTLGRKPLFGDVVEKTVRLSPVGKVVHELWIATGDLRPGVTLDSFVIMPDHMHAIVFLPHSRQARQGFPRPPRSLGSLIAGYKSACTSRVNALLGTTGVRIWQRNYHERVLRDGQALDRARRYIAANPGRWREIHKRIAREKGARCASLQI